MKKILSLALVVATSAALAAPALAQDGAMGPPAEMQKFASSAGDWTVQVKARMNPGTEWQESTGKATVEKVLDGAAYLERFEGEMMGMPMKGISLLTYNREEGEYQVSWTDNLTAATTMMTGGFDEEGTLVMKGTGKMMGQAYMMKNKVKMVSEDQHTFSMSVSFDGGENWFETMQMTYNRAK